MIHVDGSDFSIHIIVMISRFALDLYAPITERHGFPVETDRTSVTAVISTAVLRWVLKSIQLTRSLDSLPTLSVSLSYSGFP